MNNISPIVEFIELSEEENDASLHDGFLNDILVLSERRERFSFHHGMGDGHDPTYSTKMMAFIETFNQILEEKDDEAMRQIVEYVDMKRSL